MTAELLRELLQGAVASSIAIGLVLLLRRPLRRALGAEAGYRLWLLVPAAMLAVWLPAPRLPAVTAMPTVALDLFAVAAPAANTRPVDFTQPILAIWLIGATLLAAVFVLRQRRFNQRIRRQPAAAFDRVEGDGPAVFGVWRARVVLPEDFERRYSPDEQRLVLAHEQAHVRRGDLPAQVLATALRCLFWFNPLVHVGATRFRFDQELACDAVVLALFPNERRRYGDAMLKTQLAAYGLPMACHWQATHSLKERITMLKQPLPGPARRVAGALIAITLLASGGYTAWAAQPATANIPREPGATAVAAAPFTHLHDDETLTTPVYPPEALAKGIEGKVVLDILEGVDGHMRQVKVVSAEPAGVFEAAAVAAAIQWKLRPYLENGKPVERWWRVPVQFAKHNPDAVTQAATTPAMPFLTAIRDGDLVTPPEYPADAKAKGIAGKVVLEFHVVDEGRLDQVRVVSAEPAGIFEQAALAAARGWRLPSQVDPAKPEGKWFRVPVEFRPDGPPADDSVPAKS